jgi:hypothetical protein
MASNRITFIYFVVYQQQKYGNDWKFTAFFAFSHLKRRLICTFENRRIEERV